MSDVRRQLAIVTNKVIFVLCLPLYNGNKHTWGIREKRSYRKENVHDR